MTGEPGADCPQCGRRLESALCTCGWRASSSARSCTACGATSQLALDDDDVLRCAACHVTYLRERAARDPISDEELERCRSSIRASLVRMSARVRWAEGGANRSAVEPPPGVDAGGSHPENFPS